MKMATIRLIRSTTRVHNQPLVSIQSFRFLATVTEPHIAATGKSPSKSNVINSNMPIVTPETTTTPLESLPNIHPRPVRKEFISNHPITTNELEQLSIGLGQHYKPQTLSDHVAYRMVKLLRLPTDYFFKHKYLHRAVMLETVAGVPGMVAGMCRHLTSLRTMRHDGGWVHHLLHEAENERMHLMIWMKLIKPTYFDRFLVFAVQGVFFNAYFLMYLFAPKTAHRFVGYLEEEAVVSYTSFLKEIEEGRVENVPAPDLAKWYWNLSPDARLKDVVLAVRADEAAHRDVNHNFSDRLKTGQVDLRGNDFRPNSQ